MSAHKATDAEKEESAVKSEKTKAAKEAADAKAKAKSDRAAAIKDAGGGALGFLRSLSPAELRTVCTWFDLPCGEALFDADGVVSPGAGWHGKLVNGFAAFEAGYKENGDDLLTVINDNLEALAGKYKPAE